MDKGFRKAFVLVWAAAAILCAIAALIRVLGFVDDVYLEAIGALVLAVVLFIWLVLGAWLHLYKDFSEGCICREWMKDSLKRHWVALGFMICAGGMFTFAKIKIVATIFLIVVTVLLYREIRDA